MKFKSLLLPAAFAVSLNTNAGTATDYYVDFCRVGSDDRGYIEFTQGVTSRPSCTSSTYHRAMAFDTSTTGGKALYAMCLEAKARNARIYAIGTNSCTTYSVIENINWGRIID